MFNEKITNYFQQAYRERGVAGASAPGLWCPKGARMDKLSWCDKEVKASRQKWGG